MTKKVRKWKERPRGPHGHFLPKAQLGVAIKGDDSSFHPQSNQRAGYDSGYEDGETSGFASGVLFTVIVVAAAVAFFWFVCRHV